VLTSSPQATAGPQSVAKLPPLLNLSIEDDDRLYAAAEAGPASSQTHTAGVLPARI